ncbi:enoyl-CoA hydratase domain-containing protein 3, mitochondrial isoform X2 [Frankliniella occidentalis]|uniref:Enoyl-CoA hydratase domain-containing protein 3, mitochondrial n=1 Tax=Frankliniella occidentalis TaxID=133901 RepID=A0A6J1T507_FRAOC|nr:enoyl-CoA hydratase domain-containing protein 3, mitochondrial isoform X2 [Frankliniella occidentalis]
MLSTIKQILQKLSPICPKKFSSSSVSLGDGVTKVSFKDGVRTITLSGPSRNALSLKMMRELTNNIIEDENNVALRVIVLKAEGPLFSAGHNLKELTSDTDKETHRAVFKEASKLMMSILQSPVPVIASVHGLAAAAGCQLVAGCDIAICSEKAFFSTPGAQVGIFCSTPGVALVRTIPAKVAADMLFTGDSISAHQALQYGLVSRVVSEDKLDEEVSKVTTSIISKSRAVISLGKKFLYSQIQKDVYSAYRLGENVMTSNISMADAQEGISSFLQKKKPVWKHTSD